MKNPLSDAEVEASYEHYNQKRKREGYNKKQS